MILKMYIFIDILMSWLVSNKNHLIIPVSKKENLWDLDFVLLIHQNINNNFMMISVIDAEVKYLTKKKLLLWQNGKEINEK